MPLPDHPEVPVEVRALLDRRSAARDARDWSLADAIRDELATLGWDVQDGSGGSSVRPILPDPGPAGPDDVASQLDDPARVRSSLQLVVDDHVPDLVRTLSGLAAHRPTVTWELLVIANAPSEDIEAALGKASGLEPTVIRTSERLGWADARTLGLRRSLGAVTVLLDTSLEPTGDFLTPLLAAFEDPSVGIAGGWGVTSGDAREFIDAPPGEVDAVEGYCLAIRREAARAVSSFDRRFRFYRNADLDFSFAVRNAGWRAVRTEPLPLTRHEHRGWTSVPDAERDRLSRRNFYRFLRHWGDRRDLLLHPVDR